MKIRQWRKKEADVQEVYTPKYTQLVVVSHGVRVDLQLMIINILGIVILEL